MDIILCNELIQEIFHRLPPPSSSAVSLVSKRWLHLLRSSLTSLSLLFPSPSTTIFPSLSSFLSHHTHLSSLSLSLSSTTSEISRTFSDSLLLSIAASCPNLSHLCLLTGPVSHFSLLSLSSSCTHLSSLTIILSRPFSFHFLFSFLSLKTLSLIFTGVSREFNSDSFEFESNSTSELRLETLCLSGIRNGDYGLSWLWRNCKKTVKNLQLHNCESVGDNSSFSDFIQGLQSLQEVELRTCRSIVDRVLLKLSENCNSLNSLLVYDGGSKEGLLQFIRENRCNLQKIDLRLPLDLDNNHLFAIAANCRELSTLRLQSCCLVTGEGLKALGLALRNNLEELALINFDVIKKENGLLTTLAQNLRKVKKLDLSQNHMLLDKEFVSMIGSCYGLRELKLRGCSSLTNVSLTSLCKNCMHLESIDVLNCCRIDTEGIEFIVQNCSLLRKLQVEDHKLSKFARTWVANKFIEVGV